MAEIDLIGVPFDGYGRVGNQARAAGALRDAGLLDAFDHHPVVRHDHLELPAPNPQRGEATSLINEAALLAMTEALNERVGTTMTQGRFPFVYGGDCSTLLGIVTGVRDHVGDVGLVFIDGHEDTMPLDVSEDGEAANTEIGLLLGLTGRLLQGPLADRLPALDHPELAVLGPRDQAWRRQFNVGSLRDLGIWFRDWRETTAQPAECARAAVEHLRASTEHWWLHVDLDVLDPAHFAAQGLPGVPDDPDGLTWDGLTELLSTALDQGGCLGWSLAIYDPEQDPTRSDAARIVSLVSNAALALERKSGAEF